MEKLSPNFTLEELTYSATACRLKIDNTPSPEIKASLINLAKNVLQPIRNKWGQPIIVTSGYRCPLVNKAVGGAAGSQHCFDAKTEILTETGWKTYSTISKDDKVLSYNLGKDEIEVTPIDSIIIRNHKGKMMHINTLCADVMVTDKHRMMVRYTGHKYVRKGNNNISPEGQVYFDSLKTDNDKYHFELADEVFGKRRLYKCASIYNGNNTTNINLLKFCLAFVCDGYWCKKNKSLSMGFRFKKERKIEYLQKLAKELGWEYTMRVDKEGVTNFYFRSCYARIVNQLVTISKELPYSLIHLSVADKLELLRCYTFFDGHVDERDDRGRMSIVSTVRQNADILQIMAITSGLRAAIFTKESTIYSIKGITGHTKSAHLITISPRNETRCNEVGYEWIDYDGVVWCVNNRNTTVITRRNGKVSIQGNCLGEAADIKAVNIADNAKLYRLIERMVKSGELTVGQCIWEYGSSKNPKWIHVSLPTDRHKNEFFRIK